MFWHAEITMKLEIQVAPGQWMRLHKATLRGYDVPDGYQRHLPFLAVAQADLFLDEHRAFIHGALTADGQQLRRPAWRTMVQLLKREHGMQVVDADRHGEPVRFGADLLARL